MKATSSVVSLVVHLTSRFSVLGLPTETHQAHQAHQAQQLHQRQNTNNDNDNDNDSDNDNENDNDNDDDSNIVNLFCTNYQKPVIQQDDQPHQSASSATSATSKASTASPSTSPSTSTTNYDFHTHTHTPELPVIRVKNLLLHRQNNNSNVIRDELWDALERFGFVILSVSKTSEIGTIVDDLAHVIDTVFFPKTSSQIEQRIDKHKQKEKHEHNHLREQTQHLHDDHHHNTFPSTLINLPSKQRSPSRNLGNLESGFVYVSEKEIPMWKLGYELCDDVREVYRVHGGSPDSQPWPKHHTQARTKWIRAMALCRHICDEALALTLNYDTKRRPGSGVRSWKNIISKRQSDTTTNALPYYLRPTLPDRKGDKSVMYAMHYFNDEASIQARESGEVTGTDEVMINVKEHTDPSLFVLEPFLAHVEGLQVKPRPNIISGTNCHNASGSGSGAGGWISCDGKESPIHDKLKRDKTREDTDSIAMVLFVGRAFVEKSKDICGRSIVPTMHRVIGPSAPSTSRRAVIYEQKYDEYFS